MKALLSEYRGPYDTGEGIGGYDPRTAQEKAEQEELERKRNEAARNINNSELDRMRIAEIDASNAGTTGGPGGLGKYSREGEDISKMTGEEYGQYLRNLKSRKATEAQKTAEGDRQQRSNDIKKAIRDKTYILTPGQQKTLERGGERALDRLAYGLAGQEGRQAGLQARQAAYKDFRNEPGLRVPSGNYDAERIIRRTGDNVNAPEFVRTNAEAFVSATERLAQLGKTSGDRFRAAQDETIRRNREEALRTSTGQKVRDFNALVSGQQAEIKQFGQQMSNLRPDTQERMQAAMRRGLSPGQAAQEELKRKQQLGVEQLKTATAREAASRQRLSDMEAAYRAKYPGRDMSDQALQTRISSADPETVAAAKAMADARSSLTPDQLKRANSAEERRKHIEDIRAGRL